MDGFVKECHEKIEDHVLLIKFIRESCKNRELEFAKLVISNEQMNEKVKLHVLLTCFDSDEGRKFIIGASNLLPQAIFEMMLSEKLDKLDKEEILGVFEKIKNEGFKLKLIKNLYSNAKFTEIADDLVMGNRVSLSPIQLLEALKFASTEVFVKNLNRCDMTKITWKEIGFYSPDKLLAYYEAEFLKLKWHEYYSKWSFILSAFEYQFGKTFKYDNGSCDSSYKSEFLFGLLELYEKFPPFIFDLSKELSKNTPNYSDKLEIIVLDKLLFQQRPLGDVSIIINHFKSPEKWLKKPFQEYFIYSYENILLNWKLNEAEKTGLLEKILSEISDFNTSEIDFDQVPIHKFQSACWNKLFKRILGNPQILSLSQFSAFISKIEFLMTKSLEKLEKSKEADLEMGNLAASISSIEVSHWKTVMNGNLTFYVSFFKKFVDNSTILFEKSIKKSPKKIDKIPKLVEIIEKSMNLLIRYFKQLYQNQVSSSTLETRTNRLVLLIHTVKEISALKNHLADSLIKTFNLPLIMFDRQVEPDFYYKDQIKNLAKRIDEELIQKDIFGDWINDWYNTILSYFENSLSLFSVPSRDEIETFNAFKSFMVDLQLILPFETFKDQIIKNTINFLEKLDKFEFVHSKSQRFCASAIKDIDWIQKLLSTAVPRFMFHNTQLDGIFMGNLIISSIKENVNCHSKNALECAKVETILGSLTTIFSSYQSKINTRKPNYLNVFSSGLIKKLAERFKFLLFIKNYSKDCDYNNFSNSSSHFLGFSSILCRAIFAELTEREIEEIIKTSSNERASVFENLFLLKLPLDGKVFKSFVNPKIENMETLEEKVNFYSRLYKGALEQNSYELDNFDSLLAVSSFIQPKIARVDWRTKKLSHPLEGSMISKAYFSCDSPRSLSTPEHVRKVIEHLKIIWQNIMSVDPRSYYILVESFCNDFNRREFSKKFNKHLLLNLFNEVVNGLVINSKPSFDTLQLWEDFMYDLQYNALLKCHGLDFAQNARINSSIYEYKSLRLNYDILKIDHAGLKYKINENFVEWHEIAVMKLTERNYPNMKLSLNDDKSSYLVQLTSAVVSAAGEYESFTPFCAEMFNVISDYCRSNQNNVDAVQSYNSVLNQSFDIFNLNLKPFIHDKLLTSKWTDLKLPTKKNRPDYFSNHGNMLEFYKKYVRFLEEFGHLFVMRQFPLTAFYVAKYWIYQLGAPHKPHRMFEMDFYKSAIEICPSFLRSAGGDRVCQFLMKEDPIYLLNIVESSSNSRLLKKGIFESTEAQNFVIPFKNGVISKHLTEEEVSRLKAYFMKHLLDCDLAVDDRLTAAKWLSHGLLELDEIFPELYAKLPSDIKDLKLAFLKKLFDNSEVEKALKICFSDVIINDVDAIVYVFTGLASKQQKSSLFSEALFPYIDPKNPKNELVFSTKLNFSSQNAFVQLISTVNDGKILLEFWKRRSFYNEHFNTLIISGVLKVLSRENQDNCDSALFLNAVNDAVNENSAEFIKQILSVKPSRTILLDENIVPNVETDGIYFKNAEISRKYLKIIEKFLSRSKRQDDETTLAIISYCEAWHGFEGFINDRHMSASLNIIDGILIEDEVKTGIVRSLYNLFAIYAEFLSKQMTGGSDPFALLNSHFQLLLLSIESSSVSATAISISNLRKLNLIAELNSTKGKFDLSKYSSKKHNIKATIEYHRLAARLYETIKK